MDAGALEAFKTFLYPETKELLATFLTLVTTVFTLSMVFAEKFLTIGSGKIDRFVLFLTWGLFFLAIISAGWALHQLHIAGGCAYLPCLKENMISVGLRNALLFGEIGGALFGCGLLGLAFTAFRRLTRAAPANGNA